jgi:TM2 domain-containing membrane protein YozV
MNSFSTLGLGMHKFILLCFRMTLSNVLYLFIICEN